MRISKFCKNIAIFSGSMLIASAGYSSPTEPGNPSVIIPIRLHEERMFAEVNTSIGHLIMLIDTGSETTHIYNSAFKGKEISIHRKKTEMIGMGGAEKSYSSGSVPLEITFPALDSFHTRAFIDNFITDSGSFQYDGILGLDFFAAYCVALDAQNGRMEVQSKDKCVGEPSNSYTVPVQWTRQAILIPLRMKFGSTQKVISTTAILDTGAETSVMLPNQFRADAGLSRDPGTAAYVKATGVNGTVDGDLVDGVMTRMKGSPLTFTGKVVVARDRMRPHTSFLAGKALRTQTLLGAAFVKLVKLKFDPAHDCLYVYKPAN